MSKTKDHDLSRRRFLHQAGALAVGAATANAAGIEALKPAELPRRVLGRTGLEVTCMTFGSAPCGISKEVPVSEVSRITNLAIDEGINFIDTAPRYGKAEEGIGLALGRRRKQIYLASKIWADSIADAEKALAGTLKNLKTDYLDVLYFHHLGDRDVRKARLADGVFTWLLKQKKAGVCRFVGLSGHNLPGRFAPFLERGDVDVILVVVNFVDRHTYRFEESVLPVARKHNVGIVAMKVFGGPDPNTGSWNSPKAKPLVGVDNLEKAIRYALSTPGVVTANLGVHSAEQLRQNVQWIKRFRPLSTEEMQALVKCGQELAVQWGPHFGPVSETPAVSG